MIGKVKLNMIFRQVEAPASRLIDTINVVARLSHSEFLKMTGYVWVLMCIDTFFIVFNG